nr:alanine acetyltransferase [Burkholderiales bacterium]
MAESTLIQLPLPAIETERLLLTIPTPAAALRMVAFLKENAEHFAPWDPPPPHGLYSQGYWEAQLAQAVSEFREGRALRLTLFHHDGPD